MYKQVIEILSYVGGLCVAGGRSERQSKLQTPRLIA